MKNLFLSGLVFILSFSVAAQTDPQQTPTPTPTPTQTTTTTYVRPDKGERFKRYINRTVGPTAFVSPLISSTFRQIRNTPEEWGGKFPGFARRLGDSIGRNLIRQSVTYGLDEALKLDSNYYRSTKKDAKSKFSNAVLSSFTARNERGKRVIGIPTIVGTYSSQIIANETWMPKRFDYKDGLQRGTISFVSRIGFNLIREFVFK